MFRRSLLLLAVSSALTMGSIAIAEDDVVDADGDELDISVAQDDDDEFDFLKGNDGPKEPEVDNNFDLLDGEDDDFGDFKLAPADTDVAPTNPEARGELSVGSQKASKLPFDIVGKEPLTDNFPAVVVYADRDAVVVELPVLVASRGSDYDGVAYWLVAEVYADGMKVAESRQRVSKSSVAQQGPTLAFVKLLAPVPDTSGSLEIRVGRSSGGNGQPEALFSRSVSYTTGG